MKKIFMVVLLVIQGVMVVRAQDAEPTTRPDALAAFRRGNYQEAITITLNELQQDPNNMDAYTVLGWSLNQLRRYQESVQYATRALQIRRYDYRILEIMGEALFYLNRYPEALTYLQQYVSVNPTGDRIARVYYFMGESFLALGEFAHADIALTTAVYYSPQTARWWERLGFARAQLKDWRFAQRAYQEALRLAPNSTEARQGLEQVNQALTSTR